MTYLHTTPATRDRAAPGLLVALGAPPSDTEQCFIIWENGVVYCEYDWRDDLWVQRDFDPITGERADETRARSSPTVMTKRRPAPSTAAGRSRTDTSAPLIWTERSERRRTRKSKTPSPLRP